MSERYQAVLPKYNWYDYKAGRCSDLDYYKSAYGGSTGVVTKHFAIVDSRHDHPFFVVRHQKTNMFGEKIMEFKVYDIPRGLLHKEEIVGKTTNKEFWAEYSTSFAHTDYVGFLVDSFAIYVPKKKDEKAPNRKKEDKKDVKGGKTAVKKTKAAK